MDFTVENLCGFMIRSKLMPPDDVIAMRQRWYAEAKDGAGQVSLFLKWLVAKNYTTEYQAVLLSRGHADDFFLGDYKILERIGRGHMAGVYKAIHPSGQVVAIKVLPPSRAKNAQVLARFLREARLSVKLKHPHVVRSFQLGESKELNYLVMEYIEGETLDEVLQRRKRLPPAEAVRLIYQALLGLQHIHENNMVHRDLKPANLMLVPAPARGDNETTLKSNVKILDIGLARELFDENSPEPPSAEQMELTGEGVLLGTPDYLAPEQARDPRAIDVRADIYSLGCVLYHLLTGQLPFPDKNILNQMIRHATETPKPLQDFDPSIPEGLQQIVSWMMAKQPAERYPTPVRASQALQAFMMVSNEAAKPQEESPQLRRYLTWLETSDRKVGFEDETLPPGPIALPPPPKTLVPPPPPPAPAKPVAPAANVKAPAAKKPAPPAEPRRKARPEPTAKPAQVAAPVAPPAAAPVVAAPAVAAPVMAAPVAAPTSPAVPVLDDADEALDVELVEPAPAAAPASGRRKLNISRRDVLAFAMGAGTMVVVYVIWTIVSYIINLVRGWFRGGEESA